MTIKVTYKVRHDLEQILAKAEDISPVMQKVRLTLLAPKAKAAWQKSGLKSRTGQLEQAITPWSGKRSTGVTLRTKRGRDLVLPKASIHMSGAKKQKWKKKQTGKVKAHKRGWSSVSEYERRNPGSPWGDIKARPFFLKRNALSAAEQTTIAAMVERHILAKAK